jgi:uncharacterized protein (DUF1501 family)
MTMAAAPTDNRLVVIILRGAMDGLDMVQPIGDPSYAQLRPSLATDLPEAPMDLDGYFALHSGLKNLMPLWRAGQLSFAHAVSTPYRDKRSHFDGQDILEAGVTASSDMPRANKGWLNRLIQTDDRLQGMGSFLVGHEQSLILDGDADHGRWSPEVQLDVTDPTEDLLRHIYAPDPSFAKATDQALRIIDGAGDMAQARMSAHRDVARFSALQLRQQARIVSFSLTGWDTHVGQRNAIRRPLTRLSDTILELKNGLGNDWQHTTIVAVTEFGRTARQNGSGGTDHGTGGCMMFAGGALRSAKVHGQWPGLGPTDLYKDRDLMPTQDVRAYLGALIRDLYAVDSNRIADTLFPGLQDVIGRHVII